MKFKNKIFIKIFSLFFIFFFFNQFLSGLVIEDEKDLVGEGADKIVIVIDNSKVLVKYNRENKGYRTRYKREISILNKLKHPNIIELLEYNDKKMSFVLERANLNLRQFINGDYLKKLSEVDGLRVKLKILIDILSGIVFIHENGYVHRDIKPENIVIFLDKDENFEIAKLIDFSFTVEENDCITRSGSLGYLAPRVSRGAYFSDDVYAWAILAFELLYNKNIYIELKLEYGLIFFDLLINLIKDRWTPFCLKIHNLKFMDLLLEKCFRRSLNDIPTAKIILGYLNECLSLLEYWQEWSWMLEQSFPEFIIPSLRDDFFDIINPLEVGGMNDIRSFKKNKRQRITIFERSGLNKHEEIFKISGESTESMAEAQTEPSSWTDSF
ncbi:MAG: protein kinase [bacterium]